MFNSTVVFSKARYSTFFILFLFSVSGWGVDPVAAGDATTAVVKQATGDDISQATPQSYKEDQAKIDQPLSQLVGNHTPACSITGDTQAKEIWQQYKQSMESCTSTQPKAANACLESLSPQIKNTAGVLSGLGAAMSASGNSANQKCGQMGGIMDALKNGLAAFSTTCAAMKTACVTSCQSANDQLKSFVKAVNAIQIQPIDPMNPNACMQALLASGKLNTYTEEYSQKELAAEKGNYKPIASKLAVCSQDYQQAIMSAGAGILSALTSMQQASQCGNDTNGTGQAALDCNSPANAQNQTCLCQKNPRLQGCSNSLEKTGGSITGDGFSGANGSALGVAGKSGGSGLDLGSLGPAGKDTLNAEKPNDSAGGGLPPGGGGGLGGFGGGGGGSGGVSGGAPGGAGANKLNVLAGESGGGGGGFGFRGGGSSSDSLKGYMPGGANDPNRGVASVMMKQITPQVGKSNWEKVNERYRDNKPTLIGD